MKRYKNTERLGVNAVEKIFLDYGWIPRDILQTDVGIDMEVEICENDEPTGQLIGVQIKSGKSYFKENRFGEITYDGDPVHLKYWLKHSLPIILVLHNPETGHTLWEKIIEEKIQYTKSRWKIDIPKSQRLNQEALFEIKSYNRLPIYFQRLQRLAIHKNLISKINRGKYLILEIEEWVNKLSGKAKITLKKVNKNGKDITLSEGYFFHFHGPESLKTLYPWAEFQIDDDHYYDSDYEDFQNNYGIWDSEEKVYITSKADFIEYRENLSKFRGMDDASGEIKFYRLEINLNELGQSFITLNNYLENGIQFKLEI
ncbi:uncharacterized protein DUF4365 [Flavobacterium araucananum]|uniref:DUF4365 domain-containing protein n=1 Tax=Flavobacterium araucananum TaxID=946678 RepID=A0A227NK15_9FLAO|nr:DUF4365 domain-containing protein [Flavobacterium araucananum]OXE98090.1 hypothetical protein B0A64_22790 [Flavobacterium araucananum]PWJ96826.1 uncharacterized protein DUF4365 [Flavobacterium araucananum]